MVPPWLTSIKPNFQSFNILVLCLTKWSLNPFYPLESYHLARQFSLCLESSWLAHSLYIFFINLLPLSILAEECSQNSAPFKNVKYIYFLLKFKLHISGKEYKLSRSIELNGSYGVKDTGFLHTEADKRSQPRREKGFLRHAYSWRGFSMYKKSSGI